MQLNALRNSTIHLINNHITSDFTETFHVYIVDLAERYKRWKNNFYKVFLK